MTYEKCDNKLKQNEKLFVKKTLKNRCVYFLQKERYNENSIVKKPTLVEKTSINDSLSNKTDSQREICLSM